MATGHVSEDKVKELRKTRKLNKEEAEAIPSDELENDEEEQ